ncbi:pyrroloquinoline quinone biosynthesis peptide chaperone PqqD [Deinococcus koreensis]|uniref:Pyrroloquinoline quinone biosynthesis peptide chaperone PqqD n=1 Tax=Deinococcus koreensis TaxID=2054903 RepID=A0A2K3UW94_9DEIO|nr:pyrroloquinoline quinone biosynthesis peptide chaperone PqqD [Deinococcus koreensis]PNY80790.1 pyrroloquinoline quinone biosynthesis peptide chaperone PqqD [Deinococcus koreensis]
MTLRLYRGARLRYDRTRDQHVLLRAEEVTELNATAHEILSLCDGRTQAALVDELRSRYPQADPDDLAADVAEFLAEAHASQWVQRDGSGQDGAERAEPEQEGAGQDVTGHDGVGA